MMTLPERSQLWWNLQSEQALQKDPNSGPTWTEKLLSLSLEGKTKPSVLSAHGEEKEGISPNASQREESLAPYRTHCHVLMGSIIYFTQWLEGEEQGDQGLGGGWLWETPRTLWGSFPLALGEVKWLKTDTSKQLFSSIREKAGSHGGTYWCVWTLFQPCGHVLRYPGLYNYRIGAGELSQSVDRVALEEASLLRTPVFSSDYSTFLGREESTSSCM